MSDPGVSRGDLTGEDALDEAEALVTPEPGDPATTGLGATGTVTAAPAPGSESDAGRAPSETISYVERAAGAFIQALGEVPSVVDLSTEVLDGLTLLVLVKGDRATTSDVHDVRSVVEWEKRDARNDAIIVPFDALAPREKQGLDILAAAVQRAGRFMGRDGSS